MIGLMGDAKNNGQLIANMGEKRPAELGDVRNPRMGLSYAAEEILEAVESKDKETLSHALNSFFKMAYNIMKMENDEYKQKKDFRPQMSKEESEGWR